MEGYSRVKMPCSNLALLIFTLLYITFNHLNSCWAAELSPTKSSTQFINTSCKATTYPRLCFKSLSTYASTVQASPKKLAYAALSVTLTNARSSAAKMAKLSARGGLKRGETAALIDCIENVADCVYELERSMKEMGRLSGPNMRFKMSNVQTWVSAALTDENTCMEGFTDGEIEGAVKKKVRGLTVMVAQLTSNSLALIQHYLDSP